MSDQPFFELKGITKIFSKVIANKDVSFSIRRGEVVALLGENGAGKSTCMKILYGLYGSDEGDIFKDGVIQHIHSPKDAMAQGVGMIQQHFSLVAAHSVTENIILGAEKGRIDWVAKHEEIRNLAKKYSFDIEPEALIRDLTVGEQQKVEILKALYRNSELLIMDEPTAVLTPQEAWKLMLFIHEFVKQGNSVFFITHKMKEVMEVADRIVVMRNGKVYGNVLKTETNERMLSNMMIDRKLAEIQAPVYEESEINTPCLTVSHLSLQHKGEHPKLEDVSFTLHHGEILGVAGVSGNGQNELCMTLCGASPEATGTIVLGDTDISGYSIRQRIDAGIGYVPSDRHRYGMVMDMSLAENMLLKTSYRTNWTRFGLLKKQKIQQNANKIIAEFDVKATGPDALGKELSGGNQQKYIVGREIAHCGDMIIFDQPTRGLDLGAIFNVHSSIIAQRKEGKGILLISTELSEIFTLSDRILVLYKGRVLGIFKRDELTTETIGLLMAGYDPKEQTGER
ncbi:MAG: ABC transporter ATP-binding protein [Sphaerochaeta sp.]|nr:ABC transporter ATP-binding protein [Sphaerochaeta sp.]